MEGNDTYSGNYTNRVVCLAGDFSLLTEKYNAGSFVINAPLTAASGFGSVQSGTKKVLGHVDNFSLSQGLKVKFKA